MVDNIDFYCYISFRISLTEDIAKHMLDKGIHVLHYAEGGLQHEKYTDGIMHCDIS